jgi:PAS domain S-box-containing protein
MRSRNLPAGHRSIWLRYAVSVVASASAVLLRYVFHSTLRNDEPLIISPLAVVVSAVIGGFGPGLAATILTSLGAAYFFLDPHGFAVGLANDRSRLLAFFVVGTLISFLSGALHRSRRRARETSLQMEDSRRHIADILSSITDCYFAFDSSGRMITINEKAATYLGGVPAELIGRNLRDLFPDSDAIPSAFDAVAAGGEPLHIERASAIRAGRWSEIHAYPTSGGMSVYFRDITERKQAEENLAQESALNASVAELARALVASPSVAEISDLVLEHAKRLTRSSIGYVGFLDPESGRLVTPTKEHEVCDRCGMAERCPVFKEFTGPWGKVLREGRPIMANEPIAQPLPDRSHGVGDPRRHVLVNRFLSAPAMIDRLLVGQVTVANADRDYTLGDLHLIERLASLYAIAIQRNWTDEKIRESQERYRGLYESIPGGVIVYDGKGTIVEANPGATSLLGIEVEEIRGRTWRDTRRRTIHEDGSPFSGEELPSNVAIRTGKSVRGVVAGVFHPGAENPVWVLVNSEPVLDPETGEVEGVVSTFVDISERKIATEELKAERDFTAAVLETAGSLVIVLDRDGRIIRFNRACEQASGYTFREMAGRSLWDDLILPEETDGVRAAFHELLHGAVPNRHENYWLRKDGERRLISWSNTILTERGETKFVIGTGTDVTERRQAEAEVARARQDAEAANAAKDHFLAVLSHELRTPLTPVLLATGLLQKDARLPSDMAEEVRMIHRNVELESKLIDDLLDLNRITRGKLTLDMKEVDVRSVLRSTIEICTADIEARGLELRTEIEDATDLVHADSDRLRQAFWNIVKNALKFTPAGGTIAVRAGNAREDGLLQRGGIFVEIADTGIGIDPEILPRIFNPFEQGDSDVTRRFGGLGLGLTIAKTIVELHGGRIGASSPGRNRGTTFRIELPAQAAADTGRSATDAV